MEREQFGLALVGYLLESGDADGAKSPGCWRTDLGEVDVRHWASVARWHPGSAQTSCRVEPAGRRACVRAGRLYAPPVAVSPQTLSANERRIVAAWAADCAERVLVIFETAVPGDTRVRAAIDQARAFSVGDLPVDDAVRRRGGDAGAAARESRTPAARAAAYAAEQAAAVAHMGAHALGAAGYAAKASTLDADGDDASVALSEARRQVAEMTDAVARALSLLPALGENRSGPLGPGRLSQSHVGAAIREIQRLLSERS